MAMSEAPYSVTTKVGGDLLTVRGTNADEFVDNLTNLNENPLFADALTTFQSLGGGVTVQQAVANVKQAMPGTTEVGEAAPAQLEVVANQKGTKYTYGHPDAPTTSDGRPMLLMEGSNAKGPFRGWVDPTKGPKPATPVDNPEPTQWIK
jgi:hypothetical protein